MVEAGVDVSAYAMLAGLKPILAGAAVIVFSASGGQ
jgi:hypothetical protein